MIMFTYGDLDKSSKEAFYRSLTTQVQHLLDGETNELANLANVAALLNLHLENINWVGFYLWYHQENQLILGPFQGKPACIRIPLGKGVCGTAAKERKPVVVPDVMSFPGHITCDPDSRSEVVLPLVTNGRLVGVLDIDSPHPNRFDHKDAIGLSDIVQALVAGTVFQQR